MIPQGRRHGAIPGQAHKTRVPSSSGLPSHPRQQVHRRRCGEAPAISAIHTRDEGQRRSAETGCGGNFSEALRGRLLRGAQRRTVTHGELRSDRRCRSSTLQILGAAHCDEVEHRSRAGLTV